MAPRPTDTTMSDDLACFDFGDPAFATLHFSLSLMHVCLQFLRLTRYTHTSKLSITQTFPLNALILNVNLLHSFVFCTVSLKFPECHSITSLINYDSKIPHALGILFLIATHFSDTWTFPIALDTIQFLFFSVQCLSFSRILPVITFMLIFITVFLC